MSGGATPREPDGGGRGGRVLPVPGVAARPLGCAEIFLGFMAHGPIAVRFESPTEKHARRVPERSGWIGGIERSVSRRVQQALSIARARGEHESVDAILAPT